MQVSGWLAAEGKLFVHIFLHRTTPYHFEVQSEEGESATGAGVGWGPGGVT